MCDADVSVQKYPLVPGHAELRANMLIITTKNIIRIIDLITRHQTTIGSLRIVSVM